MQLTEDSTKLKLFMDVLDGTKAAVSHHDLKRISVIYGFFFSIYLFLPPFVPFS